MAKGGKGGKERQYPADDGAAAMEMEFHDILAGEAVGSGEEKNQRVIQQFRAVLQRRERRHTGSGQGSAERLRGMPRRRP